MAKERVEALPRRRRFTVPGVSRAGRPLRGKVLRRYGKLGTLVRYRERRTVTTSTGEKVSETWGRPVVIANGAEVVPR